MAGTLGGRLGVRFMGGHTMVGFTLSLVGLFAMGCLGVVTCTPASEPGASPASTPDKTIKATAEPLWVYPADTDCGTAEVTGNVTPDQFVDSMLTSALLSRYGTFTREELLMNGAIARLFYETPPSGQRDYVQAACPPYLRSGPANAPIGLLLYAGYSSCNGFRSMYGTVDISYLVESNTPDPDTAAIQLAALYSLCPQFRKIS